MATSARLLLNTLTTSICSAPPPPHCSLSPVLYRLMLAVSYTWTLEHGVKENRKTVVFQERAGVSRDRRLVLPERAEDWHRAFTLGLMLMMLLPLFHRLLTQLNPFSQWEHSYL